MAFLLPFLFPMYHVSYGAGGLLGLIRLLTRTAPVQRNCKMKALLNRARVLVKVCGLDYF